METIDRRKQTHIFPVHGRFSLDAVNLQVNPEQHRIWMNIVEQSIGRNTSGNGGLPNLVEQRYYLIFTGFDKGIRTVHESQNQVPLVALKIGQFEAEMGDSRFPMGAVYYAQELLSYRTLARQKMRTFKELLMENGFEAVKSRAVPSLSSANLSAEGLIVPAYAL